MWFKTGLLGSYHLTITRPKQDETSAYGPATNVMDPLIVNA